MTLVQLEYIVALNKYRHFVKAAEKCFVTQPTLSMQIQKLEDELNAKIFDRGKQPIEPTVIGEKIIKQAMIVLESAGKIKEIIEETRNRIQGELNIGIIPTIAPYLVPLFITQIINEYPDLHITIEELLTDQIVNALIDNDLDIGIIATPLKEPGIREIPLYYEPFVVFASKEHRFFNKDKIDAGDLSIDDMWLLNEGHCFSSHAINLCGADQIKTQSLALNYRSGSLESLSKLVEQQYGYTLLPWLSLLDMEEHKKELVREFSQPIPKREISIVLKDSFLKEKLIHVIKDKILKNIPDDLKTLGNGMLVDWK